MTGDGEQLGAWRSRLRVRLITLLGLISLAAIVVQFALTDRSLVTGFASLEAQQLAANSRSVRLNLDRFLAPLETRADRLQGTWLADQAWMTRALMADDSSDLMAWFPSADTGSALGVRRVPGETPVASLPPSDLQQLRPIVDQGPGSGWVWTGSGLVAAAARPDGNRGHLLVGRRFGQAEMDALATLTNTVLEVIPADGSALVDQASGHWCMPTASVSRAAVHRPLPAGTVAAAWG